MPCNYKNYPTNWKEISKQTISDANDKCTLCNAPNKTLVQRIPNALHNWSLFDPLLPYKAIKIVLTVHHINHDKTDNTKHNLIALCQKCHLRLDMAHHIANRKRAIGRYES